MEKIRVAVIGTGHLGAIHAKLWKGQQNATLSGIFDTDTERAAAIAAELNCKYFTDIEEAIENSDAITIAAPTVNHFDIAVKCIQNGKHCLIEKPITAKYEEAVELIKLAKDNEVLVQVGHVERFNPAIAALRSYKLDPVFIEAHRLSQFKPRAIDVSVIHDLMIHDIDIMLWLIKSKVKSVMANGVSVLTDTTDLANARITFENGAVANITASRISAKPMRKMRMFQKNAYISVDFGEQKVEVFRIGEEVENNESGVPATMLGSLESGLKNKNILFEQPPVIPQNAIAEEQKAFAEAIINNEPVPVGAAEAAEALRIAEIISEQI